MKKRLQSTGFCLVTLVTLAGAPHAHAADRIITSDTTVSARLQLNAGAAESYLVNDGVTLTFTGTGPAAGGAFNLAAGASLTLGPNPAAAAGAGRIVFLNNSSTSNGGAIYNSGTLSITNASFINTSATSGASVAGGAIFNNAANALLTLDNVDFIGCHAAHTGALRNNGAGVVTGTNLRFDGNYNTTDSTGGNGGAFGQANAGGSTVLDRAVFSGNRSRVLGGAISLSNGAITLNNPVFTDNWTGQYGGAIHIGNRPLAINITAGGTVTDYLYSGNRAGGLAAAAPLEDILSGTASFAPSAAAGGFLYNTGGANTFNIGAGASMTIGLADAADRAADSIASSSAGAQLIKTGAGLLVLNADNSGYIGSTTVAAGRLLLGNAAAKLGGKITVLSGATFGGAGVMEGRNQTGVLQTTTSIDLRAGSVLQAGADPAAAQTLAVGGTLIIAAGATLDFDLFGGTGSDRLTAATLNVQGTGTLRLGAVASGTYTLASWGAGTAFNAVNWAAGITADGVQAGRNLATALTVQSGTALRLVATLDNLALAWTGAAGALWDAAQENWSGADGVTKFLKGDTVTFDSTAANRLITVAAAGVTAREMTVAGAEDHTFGGGAITVTGTLFKTGAGTLTLAGSGTNGFARVSLGGGRLALSAPAQIGGRLGLLTFADSSTARAVFTDDATFSSGAAYDRQIINGAGINGGLLVADGKTLTFQNAVSSGGSGASVFVSNGNYFEILPHGADGTGRVVFRRNTTAAGGGG
ncbi:MAG: autotransporter-associated beta strand repeat-containing protein, partial [Opitutaceae bacterium]|nr:autotransporter-associated beta strand repeat-containing protein [Opitutaceae bacterium]